MSVNICLYDFGQMLFATYGSIFFGFINRRSDYNNMSYKLVASDSIDADRWDNYVFRHPDSVVFHLSSWQKIINQTYGCGIYSLAALSNSNKIQGVVPIVCLKTFSLKNELISIPFFDSAGIIADNEKIEKYLIAEAVNAAQKIESSKIEFRQNTPLKELVLADINSVTKDLRLTNRQHKVKMILELPGSSEKLFTSFKSKLRSQIRRPLKAGLTARIGGMELLEDFYKVFSVNMRDLGSPVHSKKLIINVLKEFKGKAKIIIAYKDYFPVACSFVVGFKDILANPWASSLREYSRFSPNMLVYWTMLEYACRNGYSRFDFGRSTLGEGTYRFKKQWGAQAYPLNWYSFSFGRQRESEDRMDEKAKFEHFIACWKRLPVSITKILGPGIRKHIGL